MIFPIKKTTHHLVQGFSSQPRLDDTISGTSPNEVSQPKPLWPIIFGIAGANSGITSVGPAGPAGPCRGSGIRNKPILSDTDHAPGWITACTLYIYINNHLYIYMPTGTSMTHTLSWYSSNLFKKKIFWNCIIKHGRCHTYDWQPGFSL